MKKLFALAAMLAMALTVSACGSNGGGSGNDGGNSGTDAAKTLIVYQNKAEVTTPMQDYAEKWGADNGVKVVVKTCTGSCDYGAAMKADINAGETPDIFVIEGITGYNLYKDIMEPMDGEAWVDQTQYEFVQDGKVYGYPVAVEGYGLAYNAEILEKAGVDPKTLTNLPAYEEAFAKIDGMKDELGLTAVVSLVSAEGSTWVLGNHNFAGYLSSGLAYDDTSVTDMALKGEVDAARLSTYADWVELLFNYTDKKMLTVNSNDEQMAEFGAGKYAFLHQGTWADQPVLEAGGTFKMGFAPHAPLGAEETNGLFAGAPSWYCLNKDSANLDLAKKFLNDLCFSEEGQKMMTEEVGLVSAFENNTHRPTGPLSSALADWIEQGGTAYSFTNQYSLPDGFNMNTLGPIYGQFALGNIDKATFIQMFADAIATLGK